MTTTSDERLTTYLDGIKSHSKLLTDVQVARWNEAVLTALGLNLPRRTKRKLARALPDEMATVLRRAFKLIPFRDPHLPREDFVRLVGRRSGHTDARFATTTTRIFFAGIKELLDTDTADAVAEALSPEVSQLWQEA